jgi:2'-5' RNA ligase
MRLLVALDVPDDVRARLSAFMHNLKETCSDARWVSADNLHVTLKFIGQVTDTALPKIQSALQPIRVAAPLYMGVRGVAFMSSPAHQRVLWTKIHSSDALPALAATIEEALAHLSIPRETRVFRPHLTLARFKSRAGLHRLREALPAAVNFDFGVACVSQFRLYQSLLHPSGAKYVALADFPLLEGGC